MIDIHTHIIPLVDDGSSSFESSVKMIQEAYNMGITDIICTPHYRKGMFEESKDLILENFLKLNNYLKECSIKINLYLGTEIYCSHNLDEDYVINNLFKINDNYLLLEFSTKTKTNILEFVHNFSLKGYKVIIAHIERYSYLTLNEIIELKAMGALIQINASSVIGREGFKTKRLTNKMIKYNLVDFIASDIHENRKNYLKDAYNYIVKKYGKEKALNLFELNAKKLLEEKANHEII